MVSKFRKNRKSNRNFHCNIDNNQNCSKSQTFRLVKKKVKEVMDKATNCARVTRTAKNCSLKRRAKKEPRTPVRQCGSVFLYNTLGYLNWDKFLSSNFVMPSIFATRKSSVTNVRLFAVTKYCKINRCILRSSINIKLQCIKRSVKHCWQKGANFETQTKA